MKTYSLIFAVITLSVISSACGKNQENDTHDQLLPLGKINEDGAVIKARAVLAIESGQSGAVARFLSPMLLTSAWAGSTGSKGIQITNGPSTVMTMSDTLWSQPQITSAVLDFGSLSISNLVDNNLKVCGTNGNQKCTHAFVRVYTTGTAGQGLWNSADGYGLPITVSMTAGQSLGTVGLNAGNAVTAQSVAISANKNVFRQSDFGATPSYQFNIDFSNAGAGDYATTLIVEYGLIKQ